MADASGAAGWGPLIESEDEKNSAGTGPVATSPETDSRARLQQKSVLFVPGVPAIRQSKVAFFNSSFPSGFA